VDVVVVREGKNLKGRVPGDIEAEGARERSDEEEDPVPAAQVTADRRAKGQAAERQGDEPHDCPNTARTCSRLSGVEPTVLSRGSAAI
jgi:hypothetical protein